MINRISSDDYIYAEFIRKYNRFVGAVKINGKRTDIHIPNTGRLAELLAPDRKVVLVRSNGKYRYKLRYIIYKDKPVLVDTIMGNRVFGDLFNNKKISALKNYRIVKREPAYKNHRFDFLIEDLNGEQFFLEVKSCTLGWKNIVSFPDAPTIRGANHIKALAETGRGILVFLIMHSGIEFFVPNYHTDFNFYNTLLNHKDDIKIFAYSAVYGRDLIINDARDVKILYPSARPVGCYMLVYWNNEEFTESVGSLGRIKFPQGYYIYTGSSKNSLFKRIEYHRRTTKKHWHLDYVKDKLKLLMDAPIVTEEDIECFLAGKVDKLSQGAIKNFGSSDCKCKSHFFFFKENPIETESFWDILFEARYKRFLEG